MERTTKAFTIGLLINERNVINDSLASSYQQHCYESALPI
jgi:hypothetical protein